MGKQWVPASKSNPRDHSGTALGPGDSNGPRGSNESAIGSKNRNDSAMGGYYNRTIMGPRHRHGTEMESGYHIESWGTL